jgi:hypothetical protein
LLRCRLLVNLHAVRQQMRRYRESLDKQRPDAPVGDVEYE